jgi:hypothetical protein
MNRFRSRHFRRDITGRGGKWITKEEDEEEDTDTRGKAKGRR